MKNIGISIDTNYSIPCSELIKLLSQIGFSHISPVWSTRQALDQIVTAAMEAGIYIQSVHAPYLGTDRLWSSNPSVSSQVKEEILSVLRACSENHIPIMVMHAWIGFDYAFNRDCLYFGNFDEIVATAEDLGIQVAFENTEGEEYLFALMDRYRSHPHIGFCWDSGHALCYNPNHNLLALYGDRLIMTHLNDNMGVSDPAGNIFWTDDLHLIPYDGIANWEQNIQDLRASKKQESLNFELKMQSKPGRHENDVYQQMSLSEYFTTAFEKASIIADCYFESR